MGLIGMSEQQFGFKLFGDQSVASTLTCGHNHLDQHNHFDRHIHYDEHTYL